MPSQTGRAAAYSTAIESAIRGQPQRGTIHSVFTAAANILFPGGFFLSLNAQFSPRMPNGLELSVARGNYPFSQLRPGMSVLVGALRLHIEAIGYSLDLSHCQHWNPQIERPTILDLELLQKNADRLSLFSAGWLLLKPAIVAKSVIRGYESAQGQNIQALATFLAGRGAGLTPGGDDILAGLMAAGWLLFGPTPSLLVTFQNILEIARSQTHPLSHYWLSQMAEGKAALPIVALLATCYKDNELQLNQAAQAVLALGATSGYELIQGLLLGFQLFIPQEYKSTDKG